jgi:hypothetical protein
MRYMMFVIIDPDKTLRPEDDTIGEWVAEVESRTLRHDGDRLRPPSAATTVRRRDGEVLVSDGPFVETREYIGGFDILECENLDEAIELASKHPVATVGAIEIRPFWPL